MAPPSNQQPDRIRALELSLPGLGAGLRRLRTDIRNSLGQIASYLDASGMAQAWTGDDEAPYVKNVPQTPRVVLLNPAAGVEVPLLQCFTGPGRLLEAWALDLRDQSQSPPDIYLQLFDSLAAPVSGTTEPTVTAIPLCEVAEYEWTYDAFLCSNGCWVALSSTALVYTAIAASQEFSITARVIP